MIQRYVFQIAVVKIEARVFSVTNKFNASVTSLKTIPIALLFFVTTTSPLRIELLN